MLPPKPTPESILALVGRYKPAFEDSWNRMEQKQQVLDGRNALLKDPPEGFVPFHSPVLKGRIRKTIDRTVTYKPQVTVVPKGEGEKEKQNANRLEPELSRWLEGMTARMSRPPWREMNRLIEERGKGVGKGPLINPDFIREKPERQTDESPESLAARTAQWAGEQDELSPLIYEAIDPLWSIIHPPTLQRTPPWVIQLSTLDIFDVMQRWPFWTDPKERAGKREHEPVDLIEYVQADYRCLIADGQPVTHIEKDAGRVKEGGVISNIYRRVYYDVLYSPYGGIGPMGEPTGARSDMAVLTREERLAISLVQILEETTIARDRLYSFMLVYMARYGLPVFLSALAAGEFNRQVKEGHIQVHPGQTPPSLLQQQPLPAFLQDLLADFAAQEDFVSLPPIGAGVRTPGTTSGYQDANLLQQVDLATIDTRDAIARTMSRTLAQCCYIVKHVMDEETASRACNVPLGSIPDAPQIVVDMEPPDESKRARNLAMAKSIENHLDEETFLTEAGFEDAPKIVKNKRLDALIASEPIALGVIVPEAIRIWQLKRAATQAEEAAAMPTEPEPPPPPPSPTPPVEAAPVEPGSLEEAQAGMESEMAMGV